MTVKGHSGGLVLIGAALALTFGPACLSPTGSARGEGASTRQNSPDIPVASPQTPTTIEIGSSGVASVDQEISAVRAKLEAFVQAQVDASLLEVNKSVVNYTDVWLNRGIIGAVAAFVVWWSRFQAKSHGYLKQRRNRLSDLAAENLAYRRVGSQPPDIKT